MKRTASSDESPDRSPESAFESDWSARQRALGNVPQAVLLKNLPARVNELIDSWHRAILRWSLAPVARTPSDWIVDLGCGYGRMAGEARSMGFTNVIGLDYEAGFCRQYQCDHALAVRGSIAQPPFAAHSLTAAYAITAFMYVGMNHAREGLRRLDASLAPGARVLLLESGAEFNQASRKILRKKLKQSLAVDGFSQQELGEGLLPTGWRPIASGTNFWITASLPFLIMFVRWPRTFAKLAKVLMKLDRPRSDFRDNGWRRFGLHRWILCEKPVSPARACRDASIATRHIRETPNMPSA